MVIVEHCFASVVWRFDMRYSMRAICVNTSKPRMLHFFVHYLESVIVDHCTTRPC